MSKKIIAASSLIFFKEKVLLIWNDDLNLWTNPGGIVPLDENNEEMLIREVKKITNFDIEILGTNSIFVPNNLGAKTLKTPLTIQEYYINRQDLSLIDFVYLCTLKNESFEWFQSDLKIKWFNKEDIKDLYLNANIKSIILSAFELISIAKEQMNYEI